MVLPGVTKLGGPGNVSQTIFILTELPQGRGPGHRKQVTRERDSSPVSIAEGEGLILARYSLTLFLYVICKLNLLDL